MFSVTPFRRRGEVTTRDFPSDPLDIFDSFFRPMHSFVRGSGTFPRIDIHEDKKANRYVVKADLPGADPSKVSVDVSNEVLTISGDYEERRKEENKDGTLVYEERRNGSFSRSFTLPGISDQHVNAQYKDGVLTVTLPKAQAQKKAIPIEIS